MRLGNGIGEIELAQRILEPFGIEIGAAQLRVDDRFDLGIERAALQAGFKSRDRGLGVVGAQRGLAGFTRVTGFGDVGLLLGAGRRAYGQCKQDNGGTDHQVANSGTAENGKTGRTLYRAAPRKTQDQKSVSAAV